MKKIASLLLMLTVTAALLCPVGVAAQATYTDEGLAYVIEDGKATITDCLSSLSGDVVIPDKIEGCPVTAIGEIAFFDCKQVASITIPDGVTTIGSQAFRGCTHLSSVKIPSSVTTVGADAFVSTAIFNNYDRWDVGGLLYVDGCLIASRIVAGEAIVAPGTRLIADGVFYESGVGVISIPDSVKQVGTNAFAGCAELTEVHYGGDSAAWGKIVMGEGNEALSAATRHDGSQLTPPKQTNPWVWLLLAVCGGAVALGCVVAMILLRKKNKAADGDTDKTSAKKEKDSAKASAKKAKRNK